MGKVEKSFTYTNFKNLSGDALDKDFKAFCVEQGATEMSKIGVVQVASITGHDSYLVYLKI